MDERKKGFLEALKSQFKGYDTEDLDRVKKRRKQVEARSPYQKPGAAADAQARGKNLMSEEEYQKRKKASEAGDS